MNISTHDGGRGGTRSLEERRPRKQEGKRVEMILWWGPGTSGNGNPGELVRNASLWAALQTCATRTQEIGSSKLCFNKPSWMTGQF